MRNTMPENIEEHSLEVAILAHALAVLRNKRFGGNVDCGRVALLAIYHDAAEIFTGDLPTPVKYHDSGISSAYKQVEKHSVEKLLSGLPEDLRASYHEMLVPDKKDAELWKLVKAADKLSALIKCIEEEKAGNTEFKNAAASQMKSLEKMSMPEVECFLKEFLPSYRLTLDEQEQ